MRLGLILLSVLVVLAPVGGMELNRWNIPPRDAEGVSLNEWYMSTCGTPTYDDEEPLVLQIKQPMCSDNF